MAGDERIELSTVVLKAIRIALKTIKPIDLYSTFILYTTIWFNTLLPPNVSINDKKIAIRAFQTAILVKLCSSKKTLTINFLLVLPKFDSCTAEKVLQVV